MASYKHYKRYCKDIENVENYEKAKADNFKSWHCHHKNGIDISREELIARGMYYDRPAEELIFLTSSEHKSLHNKGNKYNKGKHHSDETKKKMSEAAKNMSEETRKKMSKAKKGNTNTKGMRWYNNGEKCVRANECPDGFTPGRLH